MGMICSEIWTSLQGYPLHNMTSIAAALLFFAAFCHVVPLFFVFISTSCIPSGQIPFCFCKRCSRPAVSFMFIYVLFCHLQLHLETRTFSPAASHAIYRQNTGKRRRHALHWRGQANLNQLIFFSPSSPSSPLLSLNFSLP